MDLAQFCQVLHNVSRKEENKENVPPTEQSATPEQPIQSNDNRTPTLWGWIHQQIPLIQDAVIKFSTNYSLINSHKFWEIDSDTYVVENDYINTFMVKLTLHQAIFLNRFQIPAITILVPSSDEQFKLLFKISTFLAKYEDLSPCIFHLQIQPETAPKPSHIALETHKQIMSMILTHAPMLPKSVLTKMRQFLTETEAIMEKKSETNAPTNQET